MSTARMLAALALVISLSAFAQQKEIKIGFIYDVTGPFAGGGSEPAQIGTKAAVDYFNERGGVAGYRINAVFVDAQSKVDVAINEMTRLIDQEKVDLIMGEEADTMRKELALRESEEAEKAEKAEKGERAKAKALEAKAAAV